MAARLVAVALARARPVENGFSVAFHRLEDPLAALTLDADVSPQPLQQRKHRNTALPIIDAVGFEPATRCSRPFLDRAPIASRGAG